MYRTIALVTALVALSGCVSMTPRAQKIQLHSQGSNLLTDCQKLGRVDARASGFGQWSVSDMNEQAANNLRDATAAKYPEADSLVILNIDTHLNSADSSGVAYKCY